MISKFLDSQLSAAAARCIERCKSGNHWPPDLAEFVAIVGEITPSRLGLSAADVVNEYWRWRNGAWRYNRSEDFNWKNDVLYHICIEMRRQGIGRKLSDIDLKNLAVRQLEKWTKKVEQGYSIPLVRRAETKGPPPPGYSQQADPDGRYRQRGDEMLARIRSSVKDKK